MLKSEIDLYIVSTYLCVIDGWARILFKIYFPLLSLELSFNWAHDHLSRDYICHSALWVCLAPWFCFSMEYKGGQYARFPHYLLKRKLLAQHCLFSIHVTYHTDMVVTVFKVQSSRTEGNQVPASLHRQLPSQPWLLHYIFKSEANKLLLSLNLFWKLHTRNPIQYNM